MVRSSDTPHVLVVEDDAALRRTLARGLQEHGLRVQSVGDGAAALAILASDPDHAFDVVILDIGLPDSDGRDVCQALRARGVPAPVLFLTAKDRVGDLLSGFAAGGDDYLAKPFHFGELLARLRALVRRAAPLPSGTVGDLQLDPRTHALVSPQGQAALTPTEYRLLATLMAAPDQVVRRRELVRAAWPDGARVNDNSLDQYMARLRRKLGELTAERAIVTAYGIGYRFT
jgi:two-component system response regulator MprA